MLDLQKADFWKRAGALLLDAILTVILTTGFMLAIFAVTGYDSYAAESEAILADYELRYGIDLSKNYDTLTDEEKVIFDAANEEWMNDEKAQSVQMASLRLTIFGTSMGVFLSFLVLGFVVPLLFGNGQTLGKKVMVLGVMQRSGIRIRALPLFVRTILGKYTIETMVPMLILFLISFGALGVIGTVVLAAILILQIVLFIKTPANGLIHDALAGTAVVDLRSQKIFDTEEDMIAYKEEQQRREAMRSDDY